MPCSGQRESGLFGLVDGVDGILPSIAHIFFLNLAGLHSSDKFRPVNTLGSRIPVHFYSPTTDGRCTTAVGSLELHRHYRGTATFHKLRQPKYPWPLREAHRGHEHHLFWLNYLDLSGSRAFSLSLCAFRVFSWFFDEGEWLIHDWCVVHVGGQRAGRWTPGRRGTLWPVEHCWCCSLGHFATASAQGPLSPETFVH